MVALTLIDPELQGLSAADPTETMAGELLVVLELQPIHEASVFGIVAAVHEPQKRLAVELTQDRWAETILEYLRLLLDLRRRPQFSRSEIAVNRDSQLTEELWFNHRFAPPIRSV
jgi:hypothetical protein